MGIKDEIDAVVVAFDVGGDLKLFILLADDDTVNRMGTGALDNEDKRLFVGKSNQGLLYRFLSRVPDDILDRAGTYRHPDQQGPPCKLEIAFRKPSGPVGIVFHFGRDSEGPPEQIFSLVDTAVELTEPWYHKQLELDAQGKAQVVEQNQYFQDED